MKLSKIIPVFIFFSLFLFCSNSTENLPQKIQYRMKNFNGDVGLYVRHLATGETVEINADSLFPTASMIKVPILLKMFDQMEHGLLNYRDELVWYADTVNYPPDGILSSFQEGKKIELSKVISLMITYSDNHASLWCQKLAGGGEKINEWLENNGFPKTKVNSRTKGRKKNWEKYGWGQTTPKEMAEMLIKIREGRVVSPAASEEMYRILSHIYWDDEALSQIPPEIQVASKQGAIDQSRSEAVLVNAPSGDYVFCVITRNQKDTSWKHDNEGLVLLRDISRILWQHFEPDYEWKPAVGGERYY